MVIEQTQFLRAVSQFGIVVLQITAALFPLGIGLFQIEIAQKEKKIALKQIKIVVFGSFLRLLQKCWLGDIKPIKFFIPSVRAEHVQPLHVLLKVYDLLGREIATLINEEKPPGNYNYEVTFSGETRRGESLLNGWKY